MKNKTPQHRPLRARQKRFIDEFKIDLNASQAAIRAGYPAHDADKAGSRLLKQPEIQAAIEGHQAELKAKCDGDEERIIEELKCIAFSDIRDYLYVNRETGAVNVKCFDEMPPRSSRAIESITEEQVAKGQVVTKRRVKLYDKLKALELLGRHLGMFKDKMEMSGKVDGPAVFVMSRPGQSTKE